MYSVQIKYHPVAEKNAQEWLENSYEWLIKRWDSHIRDHLSNMKQFTLRVVFYENLVEDIRGEINALCDYLGIQLTGNQVGDVLDRVSVLSMKKAKYHIREGKRVHGELR